MSIEVNRPFHRPRVLIAGHLPPPMGGIGVFCQTLLGSSLPQRVDLSFVLTSSQERTLSTSGRASLTNLVYAVKDCVRFITAFVKHKPQVSHIATTFGWSFVKHSLCVVIACMFGSTEQFDIEQLVTRLIDIYSEVANAPRYGFGFSRFAS